MSPRKRSRLRALKVREVSLVDAGANQRADVLLAKRHDDEEAMSTERKLINQIAKILGLRPASTDEELGKSDDFEDELEDDVEKNDQEKAATTALMKRLEAADEAVKKANEIASNALDEVKKMREASEQRERLAKASTLVGKANVAPDAVATMMKQLDETGQAALEDLLAKHNAVLDMGFVEVGTAVAKSNGHEDKLTDVAKKLREDDPKLTKEQAVAKALQLNPDLYEG